VATTAYAGIPLTYPGGPDALVLLRGHEAETDAPPELDWDALARLDAAIACYTTGRVAAVILRELPAHGMPPERASALIRGGTLPSQETSAGTIAELADRLAASSRPDPGLLVVGEVASLRKHVRWFDARPLFGRRIVVTRSREQARELCELIENLGARAIEAPTFALVAPDDPEAVDRAAASANTYAWIIFESANAVDRFMASLTRGPRDVRALGSASLCAIGPSTAGRLGAYALKPDVVIPEFRAEGIGETLAGIREIDGRRVLLVRPDHLRDVMANDLAAHGATVTDLVAYRTAPESPDTPRAQELYRQLLDGTVDAVTFTSPTGVRRFVDLFGQEQAADLLNTTVVASIGPVTAASAAELGITTTVMPDTYTVEGLVAALVAHLGPRAG
jgi:uroporphyrinogen III methyltransferase/synthase